MKITAKVVNDFREKEHNDHVYKAGEPYPAEGFEATEERVEFLSNVHPQYNSIFLADIAREEESPEFPKHLGGGTYELSNGEKVKGKDEALEAEKALQQG